MRILPPNIRNFPESSAVSSTDKPVDGSIHIYALTQLSDFALELGFIFHDIHKKVQKYTNRYWRVKRWHIKYEILNQIKKNQILLKRFVYEVESYCITDL